MSTHSRFLALPRELREIIYHHYTFEPDGYHFDFSSGKLRNSDGWPIDLALMYTCNQVAAEMSNLALEYNTIVFSPVESESERLKAGRFHLMLHRLEHKKHGLMRTLGEPEFEEYMTREIKTKLAPKYPQFEEILDPSRTWREVSSGSICYWSQAGSVFRRFADDLFECLPATFYEAVDSFPEDNGRWIDTLDSPWRCLPPLSKFLHWNIPSEEESAEIAEIGKIHKGLTGVGYNRDIWKIIRWRYSAASAAIRFFNSLRRSTRLRIRRVLLLENQISVASPECHGMGLIPFCQENPRLRIERRVSLLKSILPAMRERSLETMLTEGEGLVRYTKLLGGHISGSIAPWIVEASALPEAGMPVGSFRFVLDGDPFPGLSSKIFDVLKEDVAWQVAISRWLYENNYSWKERNMYKYPLKEDIVPEITDIVQGNSLISCNFPTGCLVDTEQMYYQNRGLNSLGEWRSRWMDWSYKLTRFEIPPSLAPDWREFRLRELLSRELPLPPEY